VNGPLATGDARPPDLSRHKILKVSCCSRGGEFGRKARAIWGDFFDPVRGILLADLGGASTHQDAR
jgi:hypothetical protein